MDSDNAGTRDPVEDVLTEFDRRKDTLEEFCVRTKSLIEDCLDCEGVHYQLVQARVKKREKLREKYLNPKKKYIGLDDITDQAALRVITYYENEVDRVADVIRREFTVIPQKSVDKREAEPDKFGYYGLNLVCTHSYKRIRDVQFKKYGDLEFEIQVISILKHAWAELQHDWYDLKDTYPDDIKRRFYRLAAILESAESEFSDLRKAKEAYRRVVDMLGKAAGSDISVNTISLKAFISREPIVAQLDAQIAAIRDSALDQHPPSDSVLKLMSDLTRSHLINARTSRQRQHL